MPTELERSRTQIEERAGDVRRVTELPQQLEALLKKCLGSRILADGELEIAEVVDRARGDRFLVELARESYRFLEQWPSPLAIAAGKDDCAEIAERVGDPAGDLLARALAEDFPPRAVLPRDSRPESARKRTRR